MRRIVILTLALGLAGNAWAQDTKPVQVGGEADLDACGGVGRVTGLDPNGDNFLSVRAGPGTRFESVERLGPDQQVWLCDTSGSWFGVVYSKAGADCGVSSPQTNRKAYDGPCQSGWVFSKFVLPTAG